jgi:hypothetical protein
VVRGALARRDATVRRGEVLYTEKQWILEAGPLKSTLLDLIELARSLVLPWGAVPERLSENAASDDLAAVRLRNLELLQEHFRGTELAREASLRALRDRRLELRLSGAVYLDDLENVAKIAGVESSEVALRVRAVRHLATADPARAGPLLERLLSASSPSVLRAAAEGIGDLSYRPAVPRLVGLLSRADSETAATVAAALGGYGRSFGRARSPGPAGAGRRTSPGGSRAGSGKGGNGGRGGAASRLHRRLSRFEPEAHGAGGGGQHSIARGTWRRGDSRWPTFPRRMALSVSPRVRRVD